MAAFIAHQFNTGDSCAEVLTFSTLPVACAFASKEVGFAGVDYVLIYEGETDQLVAEFFG